MLYFSFLLNLVASFQGFYIVTGGKTVSERPCYLPIIKGSVEMAAMLQIVDKCTWIIGEER